MMAAEYEAKILRKEVTSLTVSNNRAEITIEDLKKKCSISKEGMTSVKKSLAEEQKEKFLSVTKGIEGLQIQITEESACSDY
eukprot:8376319-Ditylum_brightwellii.AAC.1